MEEIGKSGGGGGEFGGFYSNPGKGWWQLELVANRGLVRCGQIQDVFWRQNQLE